MVSRSAVRPRNSTRPSDQETSSSPPLRFGEVVQVVRKSSYVLLLVLLIAVIQLVVNLVDYEFNWIVRETFPDTDHRTAIIGQVYAALSVATIILHSMTGPVLRLVGVPAVLITVPVLIEAGLAAFVVWPGFLAAAVLKVASKCFDYTIFRAAKEILYIPLSYDEKTQGKQVVDVLGYRVAKGGASALLLGLAQIAAILRATVVLLVSPLAMALVAIWLWLSIVVSRRFRMKVSREEEMGATRKPQAT